MMGRQVGQADLPLHYGKAPKWLFDRMTKLSGAISEIIISDFGNVEFLRRLSDPFFFQAYANLLGWDWHSSGATPVLCGALREAFNEKEFGLKIAGGKGATSRKAPAEIRKFSDQFSFSEVKAKRLIFASKMSAKVDNTLIQCDPPYQLYHHSFILAETGEWCVIQQGMSTENKYARRYHWLSDNVQSFVNEPHTAICGCKEKNVLDMTARESEEARKASVDLVNDNPQHLRKYLRHPKQMLQLQQRQLMLTEFNGSSRIDTLTMPKHEPILSCDLTARTLQQLQTAYEIQPQNYEELVSLRGIGPKSIRALALVSELIYGCKASWKDPVKFSFALGGKDGYPHPVNRGSYDKTIEILKAAVENAKVGDKDRINAIRRLSDFVRDFRSPS